MFEVKDRNGCREGKQTQEETLTTCSYAALLFFLYFDIFRHAATVVPSKKRVGTTRTWSRDGRVAVVRVFPPAPARTRHNTAEAAGEKENVRSRR